MQRILRSVDDLPCEGFAPPPVARASAVRHRRSVPRSPSSRLGDARRLPLLADAWQRPGQPYQVADCRRWQAEALVAAGAAQLAAAVPARGVHGPPESVNHGRGELLGDPPRRPPAAPRPRAARRARAAGPRAPARKGRRTEADRSRLGTHTSIRATSPASSSSNRCSLPEPAQGDRRGDRPGQPGQRREARLPAGREGRLERSYADRRHPMKIVTVKLSPEATKDSPFPAERKLMRRNIERQKGWLVLSPRAEHIAANTGHAVREEGSAARDRRDARRGEGGPVSASGPECSSPMKGGVSSDVTTTLAVVG